MSPAIPLFDVAGELALDRDQIDTAIRRVLDSGVFVGGTEVPAFERDLAGVCGTSHAVGVGSGTDALHALYLAIGVTPGDEVVTTPFTFVATASAASRLGARIVFADIDSESLTLDPRAALVSCTDRTRAIATVNLFGYPAPIPDQAPCPVIEDAAQSIAGRAPAGIAATLSFFPTKNLGSIGNAGAVVTNDARLAARVALIRDQGSIERLHHTVIGGNFRMDELQAAVLHARLRRVIANNVARRGRAERYRALLAAAKVPAELRIQRDSAEHAYHHFVIRVPHRDALRSWLGDFGIGTGVYYPVPLHLQPCFADLGYRRGSMPNAEAAAEEVLSLPIFPGLSDEAQAHTVEAISKFYASR